MLTESERVAVLTGSLALDSPHTTLTPSNPDVEPSYKGPAALVLGADGRIEVTFHKPLTFPGVFHLPASPPGTLTHASDYPALEFTDTVGRVWKGRCRVHIPFANNEGLTFGDVDSLTSVAATPSGAHRASVVLAGSHRLPVSVLAFPHDKWDITIRGLDSGVALSAESPAALPSRMDTRLQEACWFVIGGDAPAVLVETQGPDGITTTIYSFRALKHTSLLGPPLRPRPSNGPHIAEMFVRYLQYILDDPSDRFHPTSADLRLMHSSARSTIEQAALAVSVTIEAFIRREYPKAGSPHPATAEAFASLRSYLDKWEGPHDVRNRVRSFIGQALGANPRSALLQMSREGPLLPQHYEAWQGVRHAFVHSLEQQGSTLDRLVERVRLLHQAITVLILDRIGYSGPITDYTAVRWPVVAFPLARPPEHGSPARTDGE